MSAAVPITEQEWASIAHMPWSWATDLLTDLLGELPQRDRIALTEDREHAAEILGISPAGVHRRFYRARARLRAAHPELVTTETADHQPELAA